MRSIGGAGVFSERGPRRSVMEGPPPEGTDNDERGTGIGYAQKLGGKEIRKGAHGDRP